jgi:hypothetical protein
MLARVTDDRLRQRIVVTAAAIAAVLAPACGSLQSYIRLLCGHSILTGAELAVRWAPQFFLLGNVSNDAERSGRPPAHTLLTLEVAEAAAAAMKTGRTVNGSLKPYTSVEEAMTAPAVQAAFDELKQHGITCHETVLRAINTLAGTHFELHTIGQTHALSLENRLERQLRADINLKTLTKDLDRIVQIDSAKIMLEDALSTATFLCEPDDPCLSYRKHADVRLNSASGKGLNFYVATNSRVGIVCVLLVSGTWGLNTGYTVSLSHSPFACGYGPAWRRARPWPCALARSGLASARALPRRARRARQALHTWART